MICLKLKKFCSTDRYNHSLRTAHTAKQTAKRFGVNEEKAFLAGLLHDCSRRFDENASNTLALATEAGITPTSIQLTDPVLFLHASLSKYVACRDYDIKDKEILDAIARHTSGHISMTKLDKIIYISDLTEPMRKNVDKYRHLLEYDLNEAVFQYYKDSTIKFLQKGFVLDDYASEVYNSLWIERQKNLKIKTLNI